MLRYNRNFDIIVELSTYEEYGGKLSNFKATAVMKSKKFMFVLFFAVAVLTATILKLFISYTSSTPKNVILISIDTCRADHLGCYGYKRPTTPNIDALAKEGIVFENVFTPVPMTLPAHCSMLTGTIPPYHGVHDNFDFQLGKSNITLAEILKQKGLTTDGIIAASILDSQFGIAKGFDTYNDRFDSSLKLSDRISERKTDEVTRHALNWLDEHKAKPFFLFLHYYDPHSPYKPPQPFAAKFSDHLYAGEIAYVDDCIGKVIQKLKSLALYDSTLLIVTSDHGEMLNEHGEDQHGYFIYQSAIKVPLVLKLPGRHKSKRIAEPAGLIDIVPTVCALLKTDVPPQAQGRNLCDFSSLNKERYFYCESFYPTKYKANGLLGIIANNFKYIQTTRPELYDIVKDPQESANLAASQPQRVRILQDQLKQILDQQLRRNNSEADLSISDQTRKNLESLGYVGGKINKDFEFDQNKDDPKDLINFHIKMAIANNFQFLGKNEQAKQLYLSLIAERPHVVEPYLAMADFVKQQGDLATASGYLTQAAKLDPNNFGTQNDLGVLLARQGKLDQAAERFEKSLQIIPDQFEVHSNLGMLLAMQGKLDQAVIHLEKALKLNPSLTQERDKLVDILINKKEFDRADKVKKRLGP